MINRTRILEGDDASLFTAIIQTFRSCMIEFGYDEVIFPSIPEVAALSRVLWLTEWSKAASHRRIFYVNRCNDFTQFSVEILGKPETYPDGISGDRIELVNMLQQIFGTLSVGLGAEFVIRDRVKQDKSYYIEDAFEVDAPMLGKQKQVARGERNGEGIGFIIDIDRLMLALMPENRTESEIPNLVTTE